MLSGIFDPNHTKVEQIMIHHGDMFSIDTDKPEGEILRTISLQVMLWRLPSEYLTKVISLKKGIKCIK